LAFDGYLVLRSYNDSFNSLSVHLNNIQGASKKKDHVVFIEQVKNIHSYLKDLALIWDEFVKAQGATHHVD
jgi:hypothetical protein